jgi:methylase of polypeptide subunit release factors
LRLLLDRLKALGYAFITPTPATHDRVLAHRPQAAVDLRDALGWSLPFVRGSIDLEVEQLLVQANVVDRDGERLRSRVRVSSLGGDLFLHSAHPTVDADAVFFGPDSYRFAALVTAQLAGGSRSDVTILDIGAGTGVGAITAAHVLPGARLILTDINPKALAYAAVNAAAAGLKVETRAADDPALDGVVADVAIANPPYLIDVGERLYRHGGGSLGEGVALTMVRVALDRLRPGGRVILYCGSAIVDGADPLKLKLQSLAEDLGGAMRYSELDPDVFGEELEHAPYAGRADRIAAVAAVLVKPDSR